MRSNRSRSGEEAAPAITQYLSYFVASVFTSLVAGVG